MNLIANLNEKYRFTMLQENTKKACIMKIEISIKKKEQRKRTRGN